MHIASAGESRYFGKPIPVAQPFLCSRSIQMSISHLRPLKIALRSMALLAVLAIASRGRAEDPAAEPTKADAVKTPASADDVRRWTKDLDSDIFVTRQEAARKLFEAGKEAIAPLAEASSGKSLEVITAAVDILHRLSQSDEPSTRDAAKAALEKISAGTNATAADLAKEALAPPPAANPQPGVQNLGGNIQLGGRIRIIGPGAGGNIQILPGGNLQLVPGGGIQVFRIQANANNGNQTIDVDDNGKKVHIQEDQNGLEVRVTEKVNGQDKTDTFKAKDAAELKQKFPEANKLYEKYGQNGAGALQIRAQAIAPIFAPIIPAIPAAPNAVPLPAGPGAGDKEAADQIDEARKLIAEATDGLKKNVADAPGNAAPQANDSLRKAIKELDEAGQKLDEAHRKLAP
jgi:hypothetical protein